jgi:hypothetical protein
MKYTFTIGEKTTVLTYNMNIVTVYWINTFVAIIHISSVQIVCSTSLFVSKIHS